MTETTKVYGYKRVSTEEQVGGASLDTQENAIKNYAEAHGLELVKVFHDDGFSATTAKRPALQEMLENLTSKDNDVKAVIVYNLSRISRNVESFNREIGYFLGKHDIKLYSTLEQIDDTPQGKFMRTISLAVHQLDNDVKGQTVKDNMRTVAQQGWWQGHIPLGYIRHRISIDDGVSKEHTTMLLDEATNTSDKVRMFLERFSKGDITQMELADYADSIGLKPKSGDRFSAQTINNMLKALTYAGFVCNSMTDNEPVKGLHPAIISTDTYYRNQAILQGRKPDSVVPRITADYPLKHILLCASCHKPLTGSAPTNGSGKPSPRYHCTRCGGKSISVDRADDLFEEFLQDITPTDKMIKLFRDIVHRTANEKLTDTNSKLKEIRSKQSKMDDDIQKATQAFLDGHISKDEKDSYQNKIHIQRIAVDDQLGILEDAQRLNEATIDYVCNFIAVPARMWRDADMMTKIEFQKMVSLNGIEFDIKSEKFGTDGLSTFYRLKDTQKGSEEPNDSLMVRRAGLEPARP